MPCLMSYYTIPKRQLALPAIPAPDDDRQRQEFHKWFKLPLTSDAPEQETHLGSSPPPQSLALTLELAAYKMHLINLGQFAQKTLILKLTNGPMAGLEISATAQANTLLLQVRTTDPARFEQIAGSRAALQIQLARLFDRPVTLEIGDANTASV